MIVKRHKAKINELVQFPRPFKFNGEEYDSVLMGDSGILMFINGDFCQAISPEDIRRFQKEGK